MTSREMMTDAMNEAYERGREEMKEDIMNLLRNSLDNPNLSVVSPIMVLQLALTAIKYIDED